MCGERAWCRLPEVWPTCDEATKLLTMVSMFVTPQNNSLSADTTRESSDFGAVILSPFPGIRNGHSKTPHVVKYFGLFKRSFYFPVW